MCGIAGIARFSGESPSQHLVEQMIAMLRHRGPDASGVHVADGVGLGHARLTIIDPVGGQQPMKNDDGSVWLVFNGEIYNFLELRARLKKEGVRFNTSSDTEVLLRLYETRGLDCLTSLNGQWAFCIWDRTKRRLFLSRDRMGIRPLYVCSMRDGLAFASEIKALFTLPGVRREICPEALDEIFTFWYPNAPRTIFENVEELLPGHAMTVENGQKKTWPYWQCRYHERQPISLSIGDTVDELKYILTDATRLRLRADVPVGAYVSGGIDSAVIAALTCRHSSAPFKTFSLAFAESAFDESRHQREVVSHLKTDHHTITISADRIGEVFPDVIWYTERPILRTAPAPLYLLSALVQQSGYKVVLTGEGADEILGGYDIFKEAKIRRFWARFPQSSWRPRLLQRLYPWMRDLRSQPLPYLKAFFHVRESDLCNPFFSHLPRWELTAKLKRFFAADFKARLGNFDGRSDLQASLPTTFARWEPLCQAQYLESTGLLPGYILSSQGDRMAMAHSVEGRFPFLDHRVVEFAATIPTRFKIDVLREKYPLKRMASDLVPASIQRRSKQPYRAPAATSFFTPSNARFDYVDALLSPACLAQAGIFNPAAVGKLVAKAKRGQLVGVRDNMALVGILSTQLLVDMFINNFSRSAHRGAN